MPDEGVVYVVDDDDAVRESLTFLLGASGFATEAFESAEAFLEFLPAGATGCVISDVRMPGMTGIDLLQRLSACASAVSVILVTGHGDIALAVEAMKLGASDFLEKPFDDESILSAVRRVEQRIRASGTETAERAAIDERLAALSNRERQVLDGLVAGLPNKTIAYDLGISPRTVEVYRANVMTKMDAGSLSDLVRMALIAGAGKTARPQTG